MILPLPVVFLQEKKVTSLQVNALNQSGKATRFSQKAK